MMPVVDDWVPPATEEVVALDFSDLARRVVEALEARGARYKHGEWWMLCPLHDDSDPSWALRLTDDGATWYCQGCDAQGGALDIARILGIDPGDPRPLDAATIARIEERRQAAADRQRRAEYHLRRYWEELRGSLEAAIESDLIRGLVGEGVPLDASKFFRFGVDTVRVFDDEQGSHRSVTALAIPWTVRGEIRALQFRLADPVGGRYRWRAGSSGTLFNADAVLSPEEEWEVMVVVEGAKKAASLWGHGIKSVCALPNKTGWKRIGEKGRTEFGKFKRTVFALDPDAHAQAHEAAALWPNGMVAQLPDKPDDMLVSSGGDIEEIAWYIRRARKP